jgi:hypothetical protein
MGFRIGLLGCAAALVGGCVASPPAPAPAVPATDGEGLVVTLAWGAAADLDLYVTLPGGESLYYANPGQAFVGDARCDTAAAPRTETARWRNPAPGRYRIGVDFPETCDGARIADVPYRIVVDLRGRRIEHAGTARLLVRDPAAFEVEVPAGPEAP